MDFEKGKQYMTTNRELSIIQCDQDDILYWLY